MVVTDVVLLPALDMKVRITSWDGRDFITDLQREWTVDKVKIVVMEHFLRSGDIAKTSLYHKLLHVRLAKTLNETLTLSQEGVKENDELLLLKRRLPPTFEPPERQKEDRRTPDFSTIRKLTSHLPKIPYSVKEEEATSSVDFQTELRRILISLIEASQRILCLNPSAAKIFKQAEDMLSEPLQQPKIDHAALKQLTDMGFPEARAKKALVLNKMSVMAAMEWLFQNENEPDVDVPLAELQEPLPLSSQDREPHGAEGGLLQSQGGSAESEEGSEGGLPCYTSILDTIRAFRKREFHPSSKALRQLLEMGFEEREAIQALRMFRNDQDAACDWLLGDRKHQAEIVEEGLDPSSPVYQAIMKNPTVQLGLNNPRCLLAFLQLLENPSAASQWLNDPETGPILREVSRIYQLRLDGDRVPPLSDSSPALSEASLSSTLSPVAAEGTSTSSPPQVSSSADSRPCAASKSSPAVPPR